MIVTASRICLYGGVVEIGRLMEIWQPSGVGKTVSLACGLLITAALLDFLAYSRRSSGASSTE